MALDPTMATALLSDNIKTFIALRIDLPDTTVRLLDGATEVTFSQGTFVGDDPLAGTLKSISMISESFATEAPRFQIAVFPKTADAVAELCAVPNQGSRVRIWFGLIDKDTGAVQGQPHLTIDGIIDVPRVLLTEGQRYVEIDCATSFERFLVKAEAARWINGEHQTIWPGEDGLAHVAKAGESPIWGTEPSKKK